MCTILGQPITARGMGTGTGPHHNRYWTKGKPRGGSGGGRGREGGGSALPHRGMENGNVYEGGKPQKCSALPSPPSTDKRPPRTTRRQRLVPAPSVLRQGCERAAQGTAAALPLLRKHKQTRPSLGHSRTSHGCGLPIPRCMHQCTKHPTMHTPELGTDGCGERRRRASPLPPPPSLRCPTLCVPPA
jgi:hypothetical protein